MTRLFIRKIQSKYYRAKLKEIKAKTSLTKRETQLPETFEKNKITVKHVQKKIQKKASKMPLLSIISFDRLNDFKEDWNMGKVKGLLQNLSDEDIDQLCKAWQRLQLLKRRKASLKGLRASLKGFQAEVAGNFTESTEAELELQERIAKKRLKRM